MGGTRGEAEEKACLFLLVTIGRHRGRCGVPLDPVSLVLHFLCVFAATCPWVPSLVLGQGEPPEPGGSDAPGEVHPQGEVSETRGGPSPRWGVSNPGVVHPQGGKSETRGGPSPKRGV